MRGRQVAEPANTLDHGDNLDVLRRYVKDETVGLVRLDTPGRPAVWSRGGPLAKPKDGGDSWPYLCGDY